MQFDVMVRFQQGFGEVMKIFIITAALAPDINTGRSFWPRMSRLNLHGGNTMERRTSCLQSKCRFFCRRRSRSLRRGPSAELDAANRQIGWLETAVMSLRRPSTIFSPPKKGGRRIEKKADTPPAKDADRAGCEGCQVGTSEHKRELNAPTTHDTPYCYHESLSGS